MVEWIEEEGGDYVCTLGVFEFWLYKPGVLFVVRKNWWLSMFNGGGDEPDGARVDLGLQTFPEAKAAAEAIIRESLKAALAELGGGE